MPRLLLVDDESAILGLLSRAFGRAGYEVTTATSGEQALNMCDTKTFDAVLSDVTMPGIDGHQTVSRIRERMPNAAFLLMSGVHTEGTGTCCLSRKNCTWLRKPFPPREAVSAVARSLGIKQPVPTAS